MPTYLPLAGRSVAYATGWGLAVLKIKYRIGWGFPPPAVAPMRDVDLPA